MQFKIFEIRASFSNSSVKRDPSQPPSLINSVLSNLIAEFNGSRKIIMTRKTIILTNSVTAHEIVIEIRKRIYFLDSIFTYIY